MTTRQSPKTKESEQNGQPEPQELPPELQFVPVMRHDLEDVLGELAEMRAVLTRHAAVLDALYVRLARGMQG